MNSFPLFLFLKVWRHSERFRVFAADAAMRVLSGGFSHRSRRPRRLSLSRCPRARLVQQSGRTDPSLTDNEPQSQACQFVCLTIHTGLPHVTRLSSSVKWDQKHPGGLQQMPTQALTFSLLPPSSRFSKQQFLVTASMIYVGVFKRWSKRFWVFFFFPIPPL